MSDSPTITEQLLRAIARPDVRATVGRVIELCVGAVAHLDALDQAIYQRTQAAAVENRDGLPSKQALDELAATVLEGVRRLAAYLQSCHCAADDDTTADDAAMDFDFDLGGAAAAPAWGGVDDDDIANVLDGLAPKRRPSSDERWAALSAELKAFSYALSTQLEEFDERFTRALDQERILQALRDLDDAGNALIDGVFALMSAICETYLEAFDRDQMLPGHRDTLGKALLVRRGIADLRCAVKAANRRIQDAAAPEEQRQGGVDAVAAALSAFVESEVCAVMRTADRIVLQSFHEEIAGKPVKQAAQACEGFDKYLDSLLSVNQREVLIRHDRELLNEIAATLEGIGPLGDISPHGAMDMVRQAFGKVDALYGYQDPLDALLAEWKHTAARSCEPAAIVEIGKRLAALAAAASG